MSVELLDLDIIGDFGDRARALFEMKVLRAYTAAIVSRLSQRVPFGDHTSFRVAATQPTLIARNDSSDRALFVAVDVDSIVPATVTYAASENIGLSGFALVQSQAAGVPPQPFILLPKERLFARSNIPARVVVQSEWF